MLRPHSHPAEIALGYVLFYFQNLNSLLNRRVFLADTPSGNKMAGLRFEKSGRNPKKLASWESRSFRGLHQSPTDMRGEIVLSRIFLYSLC